MLTADSSTLADAARAARRAGWRCFKLKVGMGSVEEDAQRVRLLRDTLGGDAVIRLDANGAWDEATARNALQRLAACDIEYIEQPVAADDVEALRRLRALRLIPIAADESVQRPEQARAILALGAADVLILKPMALGGILRARALYAEARDAGVDAVCTGFIDSAVGRAAVAQLCASLPMLQHAQGLGTGALFTDDTGHDDIHDGTLWLPRGDGLGFIPALEDSSHASA
jgi:o-succinylbenzoate synthase